MRPQDQSSSRTEQLDSLQHRQTLRFINQQWLARGRNRRTLTLGDVDIRSSRIPRVQGQQMSRLAKPLCLTQLARYAGNSRIVNPFFQPASTELQPPQHICELLTAQGCSRPLVKKPRRRCSPLHKTMYAAAWPPGVAARLMRCRAGQQRRLCCNCWASACSRAAQSRAAAVWLLACVPSPNPASERSCAYPTKNRAWWRRTGQ